VLQTPGGSSKPAISYHSFIRLPRANVPHKTQSITLHYRGTINHKHKHKHNSCMCLPLCQVQNVPYWTFHPISPSLLHCLLTQPMCGRKLLLTSHKTKCKKSQLQPAHYKSYSPNQAIKSCARRGMVISRRVSYKFVENLSAASSRQQTGQHSKHKC
jgi:hypothetical protein